MDRDREVEEGTRREGSREEGREGESTLIIVILLSCYNGICSIYE